MPATPVDATGGQRHDEQGNCDESECFAIYGEKPPLANYGATEGGEPAQSGGRDSGGRAVRECVSGGTSVGQFSEGETGGLGALPIQQLIEDFDGVAASSQDQARPLPGRLAGIPNKNAIDENLFDPGRQDQGIRIG